MTGKSIIIIGAGLVGLPQVHSQMNGYQTYIFEHHARLGKVAPAGNYGHCL